MNKTQNIAKLIECVNALEHPFMILQDLEFDLVAPQESRYYRAELKVLYQGAVKYFQNIQPMSVPRRIIL